MRPSSTIGPSVPAFLRKLWKIVNDPSIDDLVGWSSDGESFAIRNPPEFCYNLLPIYYKHNNMSSFIRQLNMYGFHKISNENGCDKDEIRFFHPFFQQNEARLLQHIKRKIGASKPTEDKKIPLDHIGKVLNDVKQIKGKQESVDTQLATMKQENAALWRELALLRQKHMKQQQIVNKFFSEWKSKTRKKARSNRDNIVRTGGGGYISKDLSDIENRLMGACGWISATGNEGLPNEIDPDLPETIQVDGAERNAQNICQLDSFEGNDINDAAVIQIIHEEVNDLNEVDGEPVLVTVYDEQSQTSEMIANNVVQEKEVRNASERSKNQKTKQKKNKNVKNKPRATNNTNSSSQLQHSAELYSQSSQNLCDAINNLAESMNSLAKAINTFAEALVAKNN